jgi:hypothetical protein
VGPVLPEGGPGRGLPETLSLIQDLACVVAPVKGRAAKWWAFRWEGEKRLYISAGFVDYPIATRGRRCGGPRGVSRQKCLVAPWRTPPFGDGRGGRPGGLKAFDGNNLRRRCCPTPAVIELFGLF